VLDHSFVAHIMVDTDDLDERMAQNAVTFRALACDKLTASGIGSYQQQQLLSSV